MVCLHVNYILKKKDLENLKGLWAFSILTTNNFVMLIQAWLLQVGLRVARHGHKSRVKQVN